MLASANRGGVVPVAALRSLEPSPLLRMPNPSPAPPHPGRADARHPASVAAVRALLAEAGPLTYRDLVARLGLPGRTVRWAVRRLRDDGAVASRYSLADGRRSFFFLVDRRLDGRAPRGF